MLPSPPPQPLKRNLRLDCFLLLCLAILAVIEFSALLTSGSFGAEYPQFFYLTYGKSFEQFLRSYLMFNTHWYRSTQFFAPYWIGEKFISWHNPYAWRIGELLTVLMVGGLIYWFVLVLLPGRRLAAFTAALYFTCVPVIYGPLYEISSFDFLHIVFTLLCVIAFTIGYRLRTWRGVGWTAFAWVSYVIALTCKEITIVIPVYLTILLAILYFYEPGPGERKGRLLREGIRLAPFWMMTVVYWAVHVRQIPRDAFSHTTDYRLTTNWALMLQNVKNYPLWFARIYSPTFDLTPQAGSYQNWRNNLVGSIALMLVVYVCFRLWRTSPEYRKYILAAIAWVAIFLIVPIYSGGYFWHGNLALCGYCLLFGMTFDWLVTRIQGQAVRFAFIALLIAGIVGLTRIDAAQFLVAGNYSEAYRINSTVLTHPPVPLNRVSGAALVYVEDRLGRNEWFFGSGLLFNLVYINRDLRQVVVPAMDKVSRGDCVQWLQAPKAFFFRYDDNYRWLDATEQFRAFATVKAGESVRLPRITTVSPPETRAGVDFNAQGDGISALGVAGVNFERGAEILINGQRQQTTVGTGFMSTIVRREVYSRPGNLSIQVRTADGVESEPYLFRVLK
jgi:hypothetical protein